MKNYLFIVAFCLYSGFVLSNKITVTNSGFTFTPDSINIRISDTIVFQISSMHDVLEVSQATWNANGTTPLPGFSLPVGGGELTGLSAGVHYYVCTFHASLGMKGRIFVTSGTGINEKESGNELMSVFPNPTSGKVAVQYRETGIQGSATGETYLTVYNFLGGKIFSLPNPLPGSCYELDLTTYPDGIYFLSLYDGRKTNSIRIIKR